MEYLQYRKAHTLTIREWYVLNLVINGIPSILLFANSTRVSILVLNLVINGIPSIPRRQLI